MNTDPSAVEMAIYCEKCGKKQLVLVRKSSGSSPNPALIKCMYCDEELRPVVGEIIKGPFRPQD